MWRFESHDEIVGWSYGFAKSKSVVSILETFPQTD